MNHLSLVEAEIARLRAERDALDRRLAEFVATRAVLLELAARAAGAAAEVPAAGKGKPGPVPDPDRSLKIARLLLDGPQSTPYLAKAIGASDGTVHRALVCPAGRAWFRKTDPANRLSPWDLTPEGRKAASAPAPTADK